MTDDQSNHDLSPRSWIDKITQVFSDEPTDTKSLLELLRNAEQDQVLDADALGIIEGALQVSSMQVRDIMIPRSQLVNVPAKLPPNEIIKLVKKIDIDDYERSSMNYYYANGTTKIFYIPYSYNVNDFQIRVEVNSLHESHNITGNINNNIMSSAKIEFATAPAAGKVVMITKLPTKNIINSIPSDLAVITADVTEKANYNGAMVYVAELEGQITKINLTDQGNLYDVTTLFDAESDSVNGRYIYKKPEVTINNDNKLWLYFGTGNTQKLHEQSSQIQNRVYGIKDKDFPNFVKRSTGTVSQCKTAPTCPSDTDLGWYVNLPRAQKLTAEPTVDKNSVYFPIYEPTTSTNACNTGKAILTAYDTKCGNSLLNVHLGTGVLSKVVVQGDNLYIGLAGEAKKNIAGFTSTGNLITGKSKATSSSVGGVQLEGWLENY